MIDGYPGNVSLILMTVLYEKLSSEPVELLMDILVKRVLTLLRHLKLWRYCA